MKKIVGGKGEFTKKDLAQMLGSLRSNIGSDIKGIDSKIDTLGKGLDSKIDNLGQTLDIRISKLESYMKEGFDTLSDKVDHVDARISNQIEGLGRRIDDLADNKVSKITYKDLEQRVLALELKVLPKARK